MRFAAVLMLVLASTVAAAESKTDPAVFVIELSQARLSLRGVISSTGHEQILRRTVARQFPDIRTEIDLDISSELPASWSLTTDQTLRALVHTQSATATITSGRIVLRGITSSPDAWFAALGHLEMLLAPEVSIESAVNPFSNAKSFDSLCMQLFTAAFRNHNIEFARGSKILSTSAYGPLDEVVELGTDCPSAKITISGNGDGGPANQPNGKQRAEAVAAYLARRGLAPSRLQTVGAKTSPSRHIIFSVSFPE